MTGSITLPDVVRRAAEAALSVQFGERIHIAADAPNFRSSWVFRCALLQSPGGAAPETVIVRIPREGMARSGWTGLRYEQAALEHLGASGGSLAPRFLAGGREAGFVVTEDLRDLPSVLDLLLGQDRVAARQGILSFAHGLGMLHARTVGRVGSLRDSLPIVHIPIAEQWRQVREAVIRLELPTPPGMEGEIEMLAHLLAETDDGLALSSGDCSIVNCKITTDGARFFDFEEACFRSPFVDAAVLRYPYPTGAPDWRLPSELTHQIEFAYRSELAKAYPIVLDDNRYKLGIAAACAAWTIVRLARLPKADTGPDCDPWRLLPPDWTAPAPLRSRRRQLVSTLETCIDSVCRADAFPTIAAWCERLTDALRDRWPEAADEQPDFPAFY